MNEPPKHKKHSLRKIIISLCLIIPIMYIAFNLFTVFVSKPYRTQTAISYIIPDTIKTNAVMYIPQELLPYQGGVAAYTLEDGSKVSAGSNIAYIFESEQQAQSTQEVEKLQSEIKLLQQAQNSVIGSNVETLLDHKYENLYNLIESINLGQLQTINETKTKLQLSENKLQIATHKVENFTPRIDQLNEIINQQNADNSYQKFTSPKAGYFVKKENARVQNYTLEELEGMNAAQISEAASLPSEPLGDEMIGKLISDFRWKCYFTVDLKQADKLIVDKKVNICFTDVSQNNYPAVIESVQKDEAAGVAKVVLSGDYINAEIATQQNTKITLTIKEYSGLRVDKKALRVYNGEQGVFIKYGNIAKYRKIDILFENDYYLLVNPEYKKDENELLLYDEIIVEGKDLRDEKLL